jgi:outer membrane protein TolC
MEDYKTSVGNESQKGRLDADQCLMRAFSPTMGPSRHKLGVTRSSAVRWGMTVLLAMGVAGCRTRPPGLALADPFSAPVSSSGFQPLDLKNPMGQGGVATPLPGTSPNASSPVTESHGCLAGELAVPGRPLVVPASCQEDSQAVVVMDENGQSVEDKTVRFSGVVDESEPLPLALETTSPSDQPLVFPSTGSDKSDYPDSEVQPIDLSYALAIGGANNWQIAIARTRVLEAQAQYLNAKSLWLPSLRFGIGYNNHAGKIQATEGPVIDVDRNSMFFGGGAGLGQTPLTGGAGGPPRLFVNLSLADAAFAPLVGGQLFRAARAGEGATMNDELLAVASAYFGLMESCGMLANERQAMIAAKDMTSQVSEFRGAGLSSQTEVERALTEFLDRRQMVEDVRRQIVTRSAELARLLRLPPQRQLAPIEDYVVPVDFFPASVTTDELISEALVRRPEIAAGQARLQAACWRTKQETWRPLLPNFQVGASGGTFGGGQDHLENFGSRSDVDLLAVWELQNVGLGNMALRREARSLFRRADYELGFIRDRVATEVVTAHADVASYRRQVEIGRQAMESAGESYQLNAERIQQGEGLPIELLQSITAMVNTQNGYTAAVANYHRAQYRLMRAVGEPPAAQPRPEQVELTIPAAS